MSKRTINDVGDEGAAALAEWVALVREMMSIHKKLGGGQFIVETKENKALVGELRQNIKAQERVGKRMSDLKEEMKSLMKAAESRTRASSHSS
jgi:hypothetical protein